MTRLAGNVNRQDRVSPELAFVHAPDILGVDLKSESLAKEISRARRRLLADIEVSENGVIEVAGHWVDRQTILQLVDVLSEPRNVELLENLSADEPLREFLSSASRTWAGRIRQRPYYATEPFKTRLVPSLRSALRRALTDCWHAGDGQCFGRVLRVLDHVPADGLRPEVEGFLDGYLHRLKGLERTLDAGEHDPEESRILAELSESVCVPCLNALPDVFASYRSSFFCAVRGISVTCHNDFDCSVTAARVLRTVESLELSQAEAKQRSGDAATIEQCAASETLESQFGDEVRAIDAACKKIENLPPKTAIADSERLRSLVPISILNRVPSRLRTPLIDRVGLALLLLSTRIWNEEQNYQLSRYALRIAEKMPLSSDVGKAVQSACSRLDEVWMEGIQKTFSSIITTFTNISLQIYIAQGIARRQVNTGAIDNVLKAVMNLLPSEELLAAHRRGCVPQEFYFGLTTVGVHASLVTRSSVAAWLEELANHVGEAARVVESLRRVNRRDSLILYCVVAGIIGAVLLLWFLLGG